MLMINLFHLSPAVDFQRACLRGCTVTVVAFVKRLSRLLGQHRNANNKSKHGPKTAKSKNHSLKRKQQCQNITSKKDDKTYIKVGTGYWGGGKMLMINQRKTGASRQRSTCWRYIIISRAHIMSRTYFI